MFVTGKDFNFLSNSTQKLRQMNVFTNKSISMHGLEIQSSIVLPMAESLYTELSIKVLAISGDFWLFSKTSICYSFKTTSAQWAQFTALF